MPYIIEGELVQIPRSEMGIDDKGTISIFHTIIRDRTGQISVEERYSNYLKGMKTGDKVRVVGAHAYYEDNGTKLVLSRYGSIVKI